MDASLVDRVDALLPQTQCTRCGFPSCRDYAEAVAAGLAGIDRCPPGGQAGVDTLAGLLGVASRPLDPACGSEAPLRVARIDESACIGCTLCIQACPVDAIVGAARLMHVVVTAWCSGCDLCVAPCPVDCIAMQPAGRTWTAHDAGAARQRFGARQARLAHAAGDRAARSAARARRRTAVAAALARARARRQAFESAAK
jgi:electron transport complex protein RnfB